MLRWVEIIKSWDRIKVESFANHLHQEITYQPGQEIYSTGKPSACVFFVKSGQVALDLTFVVEHCYKLPVVSVVKN